MKQTQVPVSKTYGDDNVAQILTYQTLKGRASLKRVMGSTGKIPFLMQNAITDNILEEAQIGDELEHNQSVVFQTAGAVTACYESSSLVRVELTLNTHQLYSCLEKDED